MDLISAKLGIVQSGCENALVKAVVPDENFMIGEEKRLR